jgi:hypothetical protein
VSVYIYMKNENKIFCNLVTAHLLGRFNNAATGPTNGLKKLGGGMCSVFIGIVQGASVCDGLPLAVSSLV